MAERAVEVCRTSATEIGLRLLGSACDGCAGGCGGRCNLFATGESGEFVMSLPPGPVPAIGDRMRLQLDDGSLRQRAWQGYGLAWLGLLLGAAAGFLLGRIWPAHVDLSTLAGMVAGTFIAVRFSKRELPEPVLSAVGGAISPSSKSECP